MAGQQPSSARTIMSGGYILDMCFLWHVLRIYRRRYIILEHYNISNSYARVIGVLVSIPPNFLFTRCIAHGDVFTGLTFSY